MQNRTGKKHQLNQDCAEQMLMRAAFVVNGTSIEFHYPQEVSDAQVDISEAFVIADGDSAVLTSGNSVETLANDLSKLDAKKAYFIRTGTNSGAGHWRFLYFDRYQQLWIMFSSPSNYYRMTTRSHQLTPEAIDDLIKPYGKWGQENGENSILLQEATATRVMLCANFLFDIRTSNQPDALDRMFKNTNPVAFRSELLNPYAIKPELTREPKQEPLPPRREQQLRDNINQLKAKLTEETTRLKNSRFSFLFRFEINTKQKKIVALNDILAARDLSEMQNRAANYQKNSRVMRSMKTDRTRKMINEIAVVERTTFKL